MDPYSVLKNAISKIPAMKYALAVAGVAAVVAIVLTFKLKPEVAIFGALIVIGLMFILVAFARYAGEHGSHGLAQANVLAWFFTISIVVCTTLLITSYFWHWPVSVGSSIAHGELPPDNGRPISHKEIPKVDTPSLVPVMLTAVQRGSLVPEPRTIFTILDSSSRVIRQEVPTDRNGQATVELPPGNYQLEAVGQAGALSFQVSPPRTNIAIQISSAEQGSNRSLIPFESYSVATGFSHSFFNGDILVSVVSDDVTGAPATHKITFTVGVRNRNTRTYKLQDVGSVVRLEGFEVRVTDVFDWGATFRVEDNRVLPGAARQPNAAHASQSRPNALDQDHGTTDSVTATPQRHGTADNVNVNVTSGSPKNTAGKSQEQHNSGGANTQQQSSGNSSPNISQSAPCSVTQIGGSQNQATTNCTFGEPKLKPLSLSPEQASDVAAAMRPFPDLGVRLFLVNANPDDEKFVDALGAAFGSVGIQWGKSRTAMLMWGGGTTPQGLSCAYAPDTEVAVDTLGQTLMRLGIINSPIPCKTRDDWSKSFNLYVTEK